MIDSGRFGFRFVADRWRKCRAGDQQPCINHRTAPVLLGLGARRGHAAIALVVLFVIEANLLPEDLVGPRLARGQAAVPAQVEGLRTPLDVAAVRSPLVVLRVGNEKDARTVVVLGRPTGAVDMPDLSQPIRLDMLPREMVRQAVLIAARDELGLATRDEVIDETPADAKEGERGAVEVVSFIRDNRSREQIRRIGRERPETLFAP